MTASPDHVESPVTSSAAAREPLPVLLVDDAVDLRNLLTTLLERSGDVVVVGRYGDSDSVEPALREHDVAVVVLDLSMPGGGVLDLIGRLRHTYPHLGIVVLSGYPSGSTASSCYERGADRYVEKGLPVSVLLDAIRDAWAIRHRGGSSSSVFQDDATDPGSAPSGGQR